MAHDPGEPPERCESSGDPGAFEPTLPLGDTFDEVDWKQLTEVLGAFGAAWESGAEPNLMDFVPVGATAVRHLLITELAKVDLKNRWRVGCPVPLETYAERYPELVPEGLLPTDLIYEEFHIRCQFEPLVPKEEYFERFPAQAKVLAHLLELEAGPRTTSLAKTSSLLDLRPGTVLDDFELMSRLGSGTFASVFLARQISMQRLVAVKISENRGDEPQTLGALEHPNIVRVFDQRLLHDNDLRLMYMQYVPGGTLLAVIEAARAVEPENRSGALVIDAVRRAMDQRGEIPPRETTDMAALRGKSWPHVVCHLGIDVAAALAYAHQRGVLHRDVKPANILLAADGHPMLVDFNVSFNSKLEGSSAGAFFGGSLGYMSPEQLEASSPNHARTPDDLDGRSDIYALGMVLWELLLGRRPILESSTPGGWNALLENVLAARRGGISEDLARFLPPAMPPGLEPVLHRCLEPHRERRFETADQLQRALSLCLLPDVQALLHPRPSGLLARLRLWPQLSLVVASVLPHLVLSLLNIFYNLQAVAEETGPELFRLQISIINPVAYTLGVTCFLMLARPVLSASRCLRRGTPVPASMLPRLRRRALNLGDAVAWIGVVLWLVSGVVFATWTHLRVGSAHPGVYLHFIGSQVLCGLMAGTMSFFSMTFLLLRLFTRELVEHSMEDGETLSRMAGLARRTWVYLGLYVAVPFVSIMLLALIESPFRAGLLGLAVLGAVGIGVTLRLLLLIRRDLDALAIVLLPGSRSIS